MRFPLKQAGYLSTRISTLSSFAAAAQTGGVAFMAHVGGFVAGFVLTFLFRGSGGSQPTS